MCFLVFSAVRLRESNPHMNGAVTQGDAVAAAATTAAASAAADGGNETPKLHPSLWGANVNMFLQSFSFCVMNVMCSLMFLVQFSKGPIFLSGVLLAVGVTNTVAAAALAPRMINRFGAVETCLIGSFVLGLACSTYTFIPNVWLQAVMLILMSLGWGLIQPAIMTLIGERTPTSIRGAAMGAMSMSMNLGRLIAPFVCGAMYAIDVITSTHTVDTVLVGEGFTGCTTLTPTQQSCTFSHSVFLLAGLLSAIGMLVMAVAGFGLVSSCKYVTPEQVDVENEMAANSDTSAAENIGEV